jgi:DNA end-binding protein Ku
MYYEDEVRKIEAAPAPHAPLKEAEIKVAQQLVDALAAKWDPSKYYDTFEENLKKLIKARLEGKEVTAVEKPTKPAPVVDLMAALKQSLAQMEKKPARRVEEAQHSSEVHTSGRAAGAKKPRHPRKKAA